MSKRIYTYKDDKIIKNGTTTIVLGHAEVNLNNDFGIARDKLYTELLNFQWDGFNVVSKGVSKLHPEDTYDELSGKIVASKKAEMSAIRKADKNIIYLEELLKNTLRLLNEERIALLDRYNSLSKDKH